MSDNAEFTAYQPVAGAEKPAAEKPRQAAGQDSALVGEKGLLDILRSEEEKLKRLEKMSLSQIIEEYGESGKGGIPIDKASAERLGGRPAALVEAGKISQERNEAEAEILRRHLPPDQARKIETMTLTGMDGKEYRAIVGVDSKTVNGVLRMARDTEKTKEHISELKQQLGLNGKGTDKQPDAPTIDAKGLADAIQKLGGDKGKPDAPDAPPVAPPTPGKDKTAALAR